MPELPSYPGTPRWAKTTGKVALVLVGLAILLMIFGGGQHGPWRHFSTRGSTDVATTPAENPDAATQPSATVGN